MNNKLWSKVSAFDLDNPPSEYGFSTRLSDENYWTNQFTEDAILEYKKFMYLAATSEFMVSPSEIIDTVWHQHLIFTQSYQDFCDILGKQVQHVPSTHNKADYIKFKQAKERTVKLYAEAFGEQPEHIWLFDGIFDSLNLEKAQLKLRTFIIIGMLSFICLVTPAYLLLNPLYVYIDNPYFIIGLILLTILVFFTLNLYNKIKLKSILSEFSSSSFIFHLQPFELIYLKTQKIANVINGTMNELIDQNIIKINPDNTIELNKTNSTKNKYQLQITSILSDMGAAHYPAFLNTLITKPIFCNTKNSLDAFNKYFNKSKKFGKIFYLNFAVLTTLILISFTRLVTGILRDKPIALVLIATIALVAITIMFLQHLTNQVSTSTIPDFYKAEIIPAQKLDDNWQWTYFLVGTAALTTTFIPLVNYIDRNDKNLVGSDSSCGSSCGSSCSSCGGCGGGD